MNKHLQSFHKTWKNICFLSFKRNDSREKECLLVIETSAMVTKKFMNSHCTSLRYDMTTILPLQEMCALRATSTEGFPTAIKRFVEQVQLVFKKPWKIFYMKNPVKISLALFFRAIDKEPETYKCIKIRHWRKCNDPELIVACWERYGHPKSLLRKFIRINNYMNCCSRISETTFVKMVPFLDKDDVKNIKVNRLWPFYCVVLKTNPALDPPQDDEFRFIPIRKKFDNPFFLEHVVKTRDIVVLRHIMPKVDMKELRICMATCEPLWYEATLEYPDIADGWMGKQLLNGRYENNEDFKRLFETYKVPPYVENPMNLSEDVLEKYIRFIPNFDKWMEGAVSYNNKPAVTLALQWYPNKNVSDKLLILNSRTEMLEYLLKIRRCHLTKGGFHEWLASMSQDVKLEKMFTFFDRSDLKLPKESLMWLAGFPCVRFSPWFIAWVRQRGGVCNQECIEKCTKNNAVYLLNFFFEQGWFTDRLWLTTCIVSHNKFFSSMLKYMEPSEHYFRKHCENSQCLRLMVCAGWTQFKFPLSNLIYTSSDQTILDMARECYEDGENIPGDDFLSKARIYKYHRCVAWAESVIKQDLEEDEMQTDDALNDRPFY
jgi:hypothetical protein